MSSIDFDPSVKLCLKFLHSSAPDSTEQLRLTLDDLIRQSHGSSKTLGNVLPKKYLTEEKLGSPSRSKKEKNKTVPVPQQSPQQLQIPERENDDGLDSEMPFDLLEEDLTCAVCREIAVQAGNRLVECGACHALYHQDCHKPVITDNDISTHWQCASCITTHGITVYSPSKSPTKSPTHISSGSSTPVKLTSPSSSSSSSSSKVVTPNINIISADKRLQNMKKKAAKHLHETKKKHK